MLTIRCVRLALRHRRPLAGAAARRWASAIAIPEPPPLPPSQPIAVPEPILRASGDPPLAELGLGGWSPSGMTQTCLDFLHATCGLEWWAAIVAGTVAVRLIVFPAVVMSQRNNAVMANQAPRMQFLQQQITNAKQSGDQLGTARYAQEMVRFMKENKINPLKNAVVPFVQFPFFVSFFFGLRGMARCPVESMTAGGALWFLDLTVPDQFYALPILTSITLLATIELGVDANRTGRTQLIKYALRAMPLVMLPFTINFPSAILCYWLSSNLISLLQVGLLKLPAFRTFFKIPLLIQHPVDALPPKKKLGLIGGIKEQIKTARITREVENRTKNDEISFNKAGKGPLIKTYKYDPTKVMAKSK